MSIVLIVFCLAVFAAGLLLNRDAARRNLEILRLCDVARSHNNAAKDTLAEAESLNKQTYKLLFDEMDPAALTDALVAIERADMQGMFDAEQHRRLAPLVIAMRAARSQDGSL